MIAIKNTKIIQIIKKSTLNVLDKINFFINYRKISKILPK